MMHKFSVPKRQEKYNTEQLCCAAVRFVDLMQLTLCYSEICRMLSNVVQPLMHFWVKIFRNL